MITRIKAENFRCLRSVDVPLRPFQIFVGPNGSGKSALMDVLAFLQTLTADYLDAAVTERTDNFHDLVWGRDGNQFTLSVDAAPLPDSWPPSNKDGGSPFVRYEVTIRADVTREVVAIERERVSVHRADTAPLLAAERDGTTTTYYYEAGSSPPMQNQIERVYSILARAPFLPNNFPEALWLREALRHPSIGDDGGVCLVALKVDDLRSPQPPSRDPMRVLTGSYLARFVARLQDRSLESFGDWIKHLRTCLPDLKGIRTVLRPEDRHRYLMLRYENGVEVPSWAASDGTLCLLALTILAYMVEKERTYLIEEPENAVHPTAIEAIYQSLSSVYESQVLMSSHSPILLAAAKPQELLCFSKTNKGTEVVRGDRHPVLQEWQKEVSLGELFAAGVLN